MRLNALARGATVRIAAAAAIATVTSACASAAPRAESSEPESGTFGMLAQTLLDSAATKYRRVAPMQSWTSGFRAGTLWYLHEYTLDPVLRAQAERFTLPIAAATTSESDDEAGFQLLASFGSAYRITHDERFRAPLLGAARRLASRYEPRALLADSATRARDQAWGIYGFTTLYRETREPRFLGAARRFARSALARLPEDFIPCRDVRAAGCPDRTPRDASAAAIMASGLLELSTFVRGTDSLRYREVAEEILASLASPAYLAPNTASSLLLDSAGDQPRASETDVGITDADYYFIEALLRYLQLSGQSGVRVLETRSR